MYKEKRYILRWKPPLNLHKTNDYEIGKLIKNLNHNKGLGSCSIPAKILKNHPNDLKQPLVVLINLSFQQRVFPEALKLQEQHPFLKNITPKSVLSVFSKLYEKYMYSRLYSFIIKYKILHKT